MARIKARTRKTDGGVSYTVSWVLGGGRTSANAREQSETFTSLKRAEGFKAAVELCGNQWPEGWVKGRGYVGTTPTAPRSPTLDAVHALYMLAELDKITLNRKRAGQVGRDERLYELHVRPAFGATPVDTIERDEIKRWIVRMSAAGASPSSVKNRHNVLSCLLSFASVELRLRPDNPARGVPMPQADDTRDIRFFNHGEWAVVRRCFRTDARDLIDLTLAAALRWQEVSAIRVGDLSWSTEDDKTLNIHLQRAWVKRDKVHDRDPIRFDEHENEAWKLQGLKNRSNRWVSVHGDLAVALWEAAAGRPQNAYLFTRPKGGPWRYDSFHIYRWAPAIALAKQHGLVKHGTIHMLRHTAVVWAMAAGEDIYKISAWLGHASIQITVDTYGGALNLQDPAMARQMARQMAYAQTAILPVNLRDEDVDALPVRPRTREERQRKSVAP